MTSTPWREFVENRKPGAYDPREGWRKGVLIRRGKSIFRLLDEGCYVNGGSYGTWLFDAENVATERKTTLFALRSDEIMR